jgi:hypothetical protein
VLAEHGLEDAEVNVAVGPDRRRRGAVVADAGEVAAARVISSARFCSASVVLSRASR